MLYKGKALLVYALPGLLAGLMLGGLWFRARTQDKYPRMETITLDSNGDGTNDVIYWYSNGIPTKIQMDRNFDGRMDYLEYWSNGFPVRAVADDRFDGGPSTWIEFLSGQMAVVRQDTDSNGIPDVVHYFSNSLIARTIFQPNGTGHVTRMLYYTNGILRGEAWERADSSDDTNRALYDVYGRRAH